MKNDYISLFHPFCATWRVSPKPEDNCFILFPAPFQGIKGCKQKENMSCEKAITRAATSGGSSRWKKERESLDKVSHLPLTKLRSKPRAPPASSKRATSERRRSFPLSSRLLTHHPPGLTSLSYTKITFLLLKNHHSHASVTHCTLSRHISVLLNSVWQFPSAFLWINKCYIFFYHYFCLQFLEKINIWSFMLCPNFVSFIKSLLNLAEIMFLIRRNDSGYRCGQVFYTILCYRLSWPSRLSKPISSADLHR